MSKKNKGKKLTPKAYKRKKAKELKEFKKNGLKHHNKAYVDPNLQKQAGAHGEEKKKGKNRRRKEKFKLKKSIQQGTYNQ